MLEEHSSSRSTRSSRLARLARQSRTYRVESSRVEPSGIWAIHALLLWCCFSDIQCDFRLQLSLSVSLKYMSQAQTVQCHATAAGRGTLFGSEISTITRSSILSCNFFLISFMRKIFCQEKKNLLTSVWIELTLAMFVLLFACAPLFRNLNVTLPNKRFILLFISCCCLTVNVSLL